MNFYYIHGFSVISQSMKPILRILPNNSVIELANDVPFEEECSEDLVFCETVLENLELIPYFG